MINTIKYVCGIVSFLMCCNLALFASDKKVETKVITYPAPETEKVRPSYTVWVNGQKLDIYKALSPGYEGGEYFFTYFDFEGEVEVKVHSRKAFTKRLSYTATKDEIAKAKQQYIGEIYPYDIKPIKKTPYEMVFKANKPFKALILRDDKRLPLFIFGNPIEKDAPKKDDPNVVYFGPGVHIRDRVEIKDNQTLYVAGGAVLKSTVVARNAKNVSIKGRGIISAEDFERYHSRNVAFYDCQNVEVSGVILKESMSWTLEFHSCDKVLVDNLKICCGRMIEDDAIDICNTANMIVRNTFCRAQDDIIAIKGVDRGGNGRVVKPVENILIKDCIFWTDNANIFRIGYECFAPTFKNIKVKNLKIAGYSSYVNPRGYWSHAIAWIQPSNEITIEDISFENIHIRSNGTDMPLLIVNPRKVHCSKTFGVARNCKMRNIVVEGKKGKFRGEVFVEGGDDSHLVSNISVSNATYFGEKKKADDKDVFVGPYTENIKIFKK